MEKEYISDEEFNDMLKGLLKLLEKGDIALAIKKLEKQLRDADEKDHYVPIEWD